MKLRWTTVLGPGLVGLFVLGLSIPAHGQGGPLLRLAADFKNFDFTESATADPVVDPDTGVLVDGITVFKKSLFVPLGVNTLYVTISTTGDTHDGAALWLSCRVDGAFCNGGAGGAAGAPPGWISLQKHKNVLGLGGPLDGDGGGGGGDMHDNSIYYTWCVRRAGGPATVEIKMASSGPDFETGGAAPPPVVFFEAAHFYIDASRITGPNRCTEAPKVKPSRPGSSAPVNRR